MFEVAEQMPSLGCVHVLWDEVEPRSPTLPASEYEESGELTAADIQHSIFNDVAGK
jgi:hypothetical protein